MGSPKYILPVTASISATPESAYTCRCSVHFHYPSIATQSASPSRTPISLSLRTPITALSSTKLCGCRGEKQIIPAHRICRDPFDPILGSSFRVFLFIVAFSYATANCIILTLVHNCPFLMCGPPSKSNTGETHCLAHPENQSQLLIYEFYSCILRNLSGKWMEHCIYIV